MNKKTIEIYFKYIYFCEKKYYLYLKYRKSLIIKIVAYINHYYFEVIPAIK